MSLEITIEQIHLPHQLLDNKPAYALATPFKLRARFKNTGAASETVDDPRTSAKVILWLVCKGSGEKMLAELNPGMMDPTGEMTAPTSSHISVPPGKDVELDVLIPRYFADRCLEPGWYDFSVEFLDRHSDPFNYAVMFLPDSVPGLIGLVLDEGQDKWTRGHGHGLLQRLPQAPDLRLPAPGEGPTEQQQRVERNGKIASSYLGDWPQTRDLQQMKDFFAKSTAG